MSKRENYFQASLGSRSVRYAAKGSRNITVRERECSLEMVVVRWRGSGVVPNCPNI